ncbi:MAG: serine/threonine-protein kinase [Mycobacterium sp.]
MLTAGSTFAGYRIVRLLGSGGMGEVYLAEHPRLPRRDALKVLPATVSADPGFRERFNREADLAASLWHPHIVGVHDRGEYDGQLWIAMDHVAGSDADRRLRHCPGGMPREQVVEIVAAVAQALDYAHQRGLLHRDVKPANILLTEPGESSARIILADFGIGLRVDEVSGLTATNMAVGTLRYAAPEQLRGEPLDGRADQYALAATAYHLLTGKPPVHPDPAGLDAALARALAEDPAERYDSCVEFAAALRMDSPALRRELVPVSASTERRRQFTKGWMLSAVAFTGLYLIANTHSEAPSPSAAAPMTSTTTVTTSVTTTASSPVPTTTKPPATTSASTPAAAAPLLDTACSHAQATTTTTSTSGIPLRCISGVSGYSWQRDTGNHPAQVDPAIIGQAGWVDCVARHPRADCVAAAAEIAGSPNTVGPVYPAGIYAIPSVMPYGSYAAEVGPGGSCSYTILSRAGEVIDAGSRLIAVGKPTVEIDPRAQDGTFVSFGCTPWTQINPLPTNW